MMRRLLVLLALLGPYAASAAETMYPVPKGAVEVGHEVLQPGVYEEDHFLLTEQYPGTTALRHYSHIFAGWRSCHSSDDGWQSFPDASQPEKVFVHQLIRRWVNLQNDERVTLVLSYTSPGLAIRDTPASNQQFVAIVRLRQVVADKYLTEMGVKCANGT
jgi:hypothetical protein